MIWRNIALVLLAGMCCAPKPQPTTSKAPRELRGICISAREMALPKDELLAKLDLLKRANFNALFIDTHLHGFVAYPGSAILKQPEEFAGRDVVQFLIDESHKRGLSAHLWMQYGFDAHFSGEGSPDDSMGPILARQPELLSLDSTGARFIRREQGNYYSICPANPKSHEILAKLYAEAVVMHPSADGVNLDRLHYVDSNYCYCDYCRKRFKADTGIQLKSIVPGSAQAKKFLQWKRTQNIKGVETISKAIRAARPGICITAHGVGPEEMDDKAQAWDQWTQRRLVDAIAVSMDGPDIRSAALSAIQRLGPQKSKLIAAISCNHETSIYLANIEQARTLAPLGQITWHLGDLADDLDALQKSSYATPATSPLTK